MERKRKAHQRSASMKCSSEAGVMQHPRFVGGERRLLRQKASGSQAFRFYKEVLRGLVFFCDGDNWSNRTVIGGSSALRFRGCGNQQWLRWSFGGSREM